MNDSETNAERLRQIRLAIDATLNVELLEVSDESHLHVGHAGARSGKGHFRVKVVAPEFAGLSLIKRHRLVYDAVGTLMESDIHALSIEALAPNERSE